MQLIIDPFLDSSIALALNLFEFCFVDETHLGVRAMTPLFRTFIARCTSSYWKLKKTFLAMI